MLTRSHVLRLTGATLLAAVTRVPAALAQSATANPFINILTGGTGGVYYPLGTALSNSFAAKIPGTRPSVQATKGSVENLTLLQQGKGEIAFTQGDTLGFAWVGDAEAGFRTKHDKLRGITAIYPSYIQIVATQESGIKTLADLKGKRLSVGARRSGTELNTRALLKAAGLKYEDLSKVEYLSFDDSVDLMKNRQLDATLQTAGLGVPALQQFANAFAISVVEIPGSITDRVGAPYQKKTIPKGTYRGQDADVLSAGFSDYLVTRADVPADLVYQITGAIFSSLAALVAAHPAASGIIPAQALIGMPVPLHPGAEKYFKEIGLLK